jgi:hypothetical protein|tara:strand:+ start:484 stop:1098 length:615 start_codon:yes stop_codon:yes gene_type:complete
MARSDVKAVFLTADTNAVDAASVSAAERANTDFTIGGTDASGGVATFSSGRIITCTTAGTGDNGKTVTITGTDVNGDSQSEVITLTGSATAHAGSKYFKTVTAAAASAQPAANVSIGMAAGCADVIFAGRSRLKGVYIVNSGTAGTIDFLTTSPTGTSTMKLGTVASATVTRDVTIPEEGVVFSDGVYIQYTVSTFTTMTAYHA